MTARWLTYAEARERAARRDQNVRSAFAAVGYLAFGWGLGALLKMWLS